MTNIPTDAEYLESLKKPITDEKLAELDDWYSKCSSNSLKFCDADYLAMRERLRVTESELDKALAERDRLRSALEWYSDFNNYVFRNGIQFNYVVVADKGGRALQALAYVPPREGTE